MCSNSREVEKNTTVECPIGGSITNAQHKIQEMIFDKFVLSTVFNNLIYLYLSYLFCISQYFI